MVRASLAGLGVALAAAPLGCFVVWRRMAYFGDATAHASLLGVALALSFSMSVFVGALVVALMMALVVGALSGRGYAMDTLLGVLAHSALAFGLVAASFLTGVRIDLMAYLLGDIVAVGKTDLAVIWGGAALVLALISVESGGRVTAVSNKGATGLMQLIPATAERFGITDARDPAQNIRAGVAYLDWLMEEFGNDPVLALAGYNAGEGAVRRHEGVPPFNETRAYVPRVLAAWNVARMMCSTPPELPGDGCVFNPTLTGS